jgi:C4-type Zn-finger protein
MAANTYDHVSHQITTIEGTAEKFRRRLQRLIEATAHDPNGVDVLKTRCAKAIEYFTAQIAGTKSSDCTVPDFSMSCSTAALITRDPQIAAAAGVECLGG